MSLAEMTLAEKLAAIAENEPKVYEAGKRAEQDAFWDSYAANAVSGWVYRFAGYGWNDNTFKPKKNITIIEYGSRQANYMFAQNQCTNIEKAFIDNGVTLNTRNAMNLENMFYYSRTISVPEIDTTNCYSLSGTFRFASNLQTIRKLILKNDGSQPFTYVFGNCPALENIVIEGVIGQNGFDTHWSTKLSKDSITSIVNALSDTATGKTLTLSKEAVEAAFGSGNIQLSPSFDADFLANRGYTVTDNQDGSVTISGGTEQSAGCISFSPGAVPQGTYELSHLETGEGAGVGLDVTIYDANGDSVSNFALHSGNKTQITIEEGYTLSLEIGPYGEYDNKIFKPTLNRLGWESLQDSKPNWTISLV